MKDNPNDLFKYLTATSNMNDLKKIILRTSEIFHEFLTLEEKYKNKEIGNYEDLQKYRKLQIVMPYIKYIIYGLEPLITAGDKVKVLPRKKGQETEYPCYVDEMTKYVGKIFIVKKIIPEGFIKLDMENSSYWRREWLEIVKEGK